MMGINVENVLIKQNIIAACRALVEFGTPYVTNPEFTEGGYVFNGYSGVYKYIRLYFTSLDGDRKVIRITSNMSPDSVYKIIKRNLK